MDFSNITSMYGDVYSTAANQTASKLKDKLDGSDYSKANSEELMDACKQFEAYFVEQMYKAMMKTIPENDNYSNYTSGIMDYYKDQMIQSVAEETSNGSGLGLAQMLFEQMKRNYGISDAAADGSEEGEVNAVEAVSE